MLGIGLEPRHGWAQVSWGWAGHWTTMGRLVLPEGCRCLRHFLGFIGHLFLVIPSGHLGYPPDPMLDLAWLLAATAPEGSCRVGHHLGVPQCCALCALVGGAVVAAGYHGDEEARAQGSLWPATGNCTGSWRQTM